MSFSYKEVQILPYPCELIYEVISDVPKYPSFVKWIERVDILEQCNNKVIYQISVSFPPLKQKFSTSDVFFKNEKIEITLVDGLFEYLNNTWLFNEISANTTEVSFEINFSLKSKILHQLFTQVFSKAYYSVLSSFKLQADKKIIDRSEEKKCIFCN